MVRLLRKLRTHKSQPRHARYLDRKPRDKEPATHRDNGNPGNSYKEEDGQDTADNAARAAVITTPIPPD